MKALDICPGIVEAEQIVYDEFVERLQQKRHTSQRCAVQRLALLMTDRFLDDLDHELCVLWPEVKLRSFQICEEPLNCLLQLDTRNLFSAPDRLTVFAHSRPVLAVNLLQWMRARQLSRFFSLRQERYCLTSS